MKPRATFYTVSDERFFVGTVALLNSLRLTANEGEIIVLDRGLSHQQVEMLTLQATVVQSPELKTMHPWLLKAAADLAPRAGVTILIDSDMVVTQNLDDIVEQAYDGAISAYPDHHLARERWFPEWSDAFGLQAPLRRGQTYVNAGFLAYSRDRWPHFLGRVREVCERIPADRVGVGPSRQPFWAGDQDVVNALLMSEMPASAIAIGPSHEEVYWDAFREVDVEDLESLSCVYDQVPVRILHASFVPKPWFGEAWKRVRADDAYICCMRRLLSDPTLPISLPAESVVPWLRPGGHFRAASHLLSVFNDFAALTLRTIVRPTRSAVRRRLHAEVDAS